MENETKYVSVLETIIKALVNNPDQVEVTKTRDDMGILLSVKLADGDAGRLIGKKGNLITAIRTVIYHVGRHEDARVNVKLDIPEVKGGERSS